MLFYFESCIASNEDKEGKHTDPSGKYLHSAERSSIIVHAVFTGFSWRLLLPQEVPVSAGQVENYVLLLVLLSIFAGGTLVLLSLLLLFCHRCCMGGRRYSRCEATSETQTKIWRLSFL